MVESTMIDVGESGCVIYSVVVYPNKFVAIAAG